MTQDPIYLPALRCYVGDRWFYCSAMTFKQVAGIVVRSDELVTSKALGDLIQRTLSDRSKEIVRYIETQNQRFFNSLVLAVFEGDPEWLDIRLMDSNFLPDDLPEQDIDRVNERIGLLRMSGAEKIFALDGQHRVEGIKQAVGKSDKFGSEEISVLFVSHKAGPEGKERTRRLFTTLNRYARAVSKYEKIALDEDDAAAIITRRLLNDHPYLSGSRTAYSKSAAIPASDRTSLTTLPVVYDIVLTLIQNRRIAEVEWTPGRISYPRPSDEVLAELMKFAGSFWDQLGQWDAEFAQAASFDDEQRSKLNMRSKAGGRVVFRPVLHLAIASTVRRWIERGDTLEDAFKRMTDIPKALTDSHWTRVIWDPIGKKMIATGEAKAVAEGLLLYWSGYEVDVDRLTERYQSLTGFEGAKLPEL